MGCGITDTHQSRRSNITSGIQCCHDRHDITENEGHRRRRFVERSRHAHRHSLQTISIWWQPDGEHIAAQRASWRRSVRPRTTHILITTRSRPIFISGDARRPLHRRSEDKLIKVCCSPPASLPRASSMRGRMAAPPLDLTAPYSRHEVRVWHPWWTIESTFGKRRGERPRLVKQRARAHALRPDRRAPLRLGVTPSRSSTQRRHRRRQAPSHANCGFTCATADVTSALA